jgi:predicted DNA-binding transcriptional regulator AlpA
MTAQLDQSAHQLTTRDTARLLGISYRTLEGWRLTLNGPPFVRVGPRLVRYDLLDVVAWLQLHRNQTVGA